jgi:hypothetical protein
MQVLLELNACLATAQNSRFSVFDQSHRKWCASVLVLYVCIPYGPVCISSSLAFRPANVRIPPNTLRFCYFSSTPLLYTVWYWTKTQFFQNTERIVILENADYLGRAVHTSETKQGHMQPFGHFYFFSLVLMCIKCWSFVGKCLDADIHWFQCSIFLY